MTIWSEGIFLVPHLLWYKTPVFAALSKGLVSLYDKQEALHD